MTYDPDADAAFIYISDPIERGGVASSSVLDRFIPGASLIASFDATRDCLGSSCWARVNGCAPTY
jgi:uncharacterized protein YuzE